MKKWITLFTFLILFIAGIVYGDWLIIQAKTIGCGLYINNQDGTGTTIEMEDADGDTVAKIDCGETTDDVLTVTGATSVAIPSLTITPNSSSPQSITLYEDTDDGSNYATIIAPDSGKGYTSNRTIETGDFGGAMLHLLDQEYGTSTAAGGNAATVTGSQLVFANAEYRAGKSIIYEGVGYVIGTADDKHIRLMADSTTLVTWTIAAATAGDFYFRILVTQNTNNLNQLKGFCVLMFEGASPLYADDLTAAGHDWDTGATLSLQIQCDNVADLLSINGLFVVAYEKYHL